MELYPSQKISSWTVIKRDLPKGKNQGAFWICSCICGTVKSVRAVYLRSGLSTGCGCRGKFDKEKQKKRFSKKFKINQESNCWEWIGSFTSGGYGNFFSGGKLYRAHRYSYQLFVGEIPDNGVIMHRCDNVKCVNPDHLTAGTAKLNNIDAVLKNRHRWRSNRESLNPDFTPVASL